MNEALEVKAMNYEYEKPIPWSKLVVGISSTVIRVPGVLALRHVPYENESTYQREQANCLVVISSITITFLGVTVERKSAHLERLSESGLVLYWQ